MSLSSVSPVIPTVEGCPLLLRTRAFVVSQLTAPVLEYVYLNRSSGQVTDLGAVLAPETGDPGSVVVRVAEWFAADKPRSGVAWQLTGSSSDPAAGVLQVPLTAAVTAKAGVYRIDWGVFDGASVLLGTQRSYLVVESSGFSESTARQGPPTLDEIRMALRDSDRAENFTLDDVEFSDAQFAWALARPVELWNTDPPQLTPRLSTQNFPYREQWLRATVGFLCEAAAQGYRRDAGLVDEAGGVAVRDKAKEPVYAAEARARMAEFREFVLLKKNEIGMNRMYKSYGSPEYRGRGCRGRSGW